MLKKTVTYTNYNDEEVTEDFYFALNEAEVLDKELSVEGGYSALLEKIVAEKNGKEMIRLFKELVLISYGEKSLDGKRFMKSEEIQANFQASAAYPQIFMELAMDDKAAEEFANGILPAKLTERFAKEQKDVRATVTRDDIEQRGAYGPEVSALLEEYKAEDEQRLTTISLSQAEFMQARLSEEQFEQFMADKRVVG